MWVLYTMLIVQWRFENILLIFTVLLGLSLQVGVKLMDLVSSKCLNCPIQKTCLYYLQPLTPKKPHCKLLVIITFQCGNARLLLPCNYRFPCLQHMVKSHKGIKICVMARTHLPEYIQVLTHIRRDPQGKYGSGAPRDPLYQAKATDNKLQTNWSY